MEDGCGGRRVLGGLRLVPEQSGGLADYQLPGTPWGFSSGVSTSLLQSNRGLSFFYLNSRTKLSAIAKRRCKTFSKN